MKFVRGLRAWGFGVFIYGLLTCYDRGINVWNWVWVYIVA